VVLAVAILGLGVAAQAAPGYKVLHSFSGPDGDSARGVVILDSEGNLYGTTFGGGNGDCYGGGCGVVYEVSPQADGKWTEAVLYNFQGGSDGQGPSGDLLLDTSGGLYGTTQLGGGRGAGTAFRLAPDSGDWQETVLHSFGQSSQDGTLPLAGLVSDAAGDLYGTTYGGGADLGGTAFELGPRPSGWTETILNSFQVWWNYGRNPPGGSNPSTALTHAGHGNLYGTTQFGGGIGCQSCSGGGVVFELIRHAGHRQERVLHAFSGIEKTDGALPLSAVIRDLAGNLYGTTEVGGGSSSCQGGCGTVYKLTPGKSGKPWKETILYNFDNAQYGANPGGDIVMDKAGSIYGTAGAPGCGVIYQLSPGPKGKWTYTRLHQFDCSDGDSPNGVTWGRNGKLYGSTSLGGADDMGVVFELAP